MSKRNICVLLAVVLWWSAGVCQQMETTMTKTDKRSWSHAMTLWFNKVVHEDVQDMKTQLFNRKELVTKLKQFFADTVDGIACLGGYPVVSSQQEGYEQRFEQDIRTALWVSTLDAYAVPDDEHVPQISAREEDTGAGIPDLDFMYPEEQYL